MKAARNRSIQSLERAFDILDLFREDSQQELSLKEICSATDLHASTAHHLIATMVGRGYMSQDSDTRRYMLGSALLRLRLAALDGIDLQRVAHPIVRELMECTQEEAYLAILRGWHTLSVITLPSPQAVRVVRPQGPEPSLHATASGKSFLAYGEDGFVERYLREVSLTGFTQNTIIAPSILREEIARIRNVGIAYDYEEHVRGVGCIGAPVCDGNGAMVASLSISYPTFRADDAVIAKWTADVTRCAEALSEQLGYVDAKRTGTDAQWLT